MIAIGSANPAPVESPSAVVRLGRVTTSPARHDSYAAGACADWAPHTRAR